MEMIDKYKKNGYIQAETLAQFQKWTAPITHCENGVVQYFERFDIEQDGDVLFSTGHHSQRHPYECWKAPGAFYILKPGESI